MSRFYLMLFLMVAICSKTVHAFLEIFVVLKWKLRAQKIRIENVSLPWLLSLVVSYPFSKLNETTIEKERERERVISVGREFPVSGCCCCKTSKQLIRSPSPPLFSSLPTLFCTAGYCVAAVFRSEIRLCGVSGWGEGELWICLDGKAFLPLDHAFARKERKLR